MSANQPMLQSFRGILLGTMDEYSLDQPEKVWTLCDGRDRLDCLIPCSGLLYRLLSSPLESQWFQMAGRQSSADDVPPIVIGARPDDFENDALELLPPDTCPVEDVHADTTALIRKIETYPLRALVEKVLQDREVVSRYWTMPAAAKHNSLVAGLESTGSQVTLVEQYP